MTLKTITLNLDDKDIGKVKRILDKSNADTFSRFVREAIREKLAGIKKNQK